ncbi:MAG: 2Fe-2S iron-sulfur cluster binding domain-containing protein [Synechococcales cyanobacterium RM1_1_8]|nr:2Fe-2S iron-sulfur cluster binding domain-containing protein [Synechococcales cyanobacterium RM1_1_8]
MANTYSVELVRDGSSQTIQVRDDQTILEAAGTAGVELPSSCNAGVCTTCAAKILSGEVEQPDAMGASLELQVQGFTLLCAAYPRSDLKIETHQEDELYRLQFGQFQN